jgi:hypothetical protein
MRILPLFIGGFFIAGIASVGAYQLLVVPNQVDLTKATAPAITEVTTKATSQNELFGKPWIEGTKIDPPAQQLLANDKTKAKVEPKTATLTSTTLTLDKTFRAIEEIQKKFIANDPNVVVLSISQSTIPTKELAAKYKANVEKGPLNNQFGWPHIVLDSEGNAFSIVSIFKTVQNTVDRSSALFTSKGVQYKKSVDQNSIQVELNGKVTDVELQALGKLLKELNSDGTMPPSRVFARWAVTPTTSKQDNAIINPSGKITPELTKLVQYAGYAPGSENVIIKANLQNAILRLRSKTVKQTPNDFQINYLIKAYESLK